MSQIDDLSRFDDSLIENLRWLIANPEFEERPPSITEFLGTGYLDILEAIRPRILEELQAIFGPEYTTGQLANVSEALITGAIGIGKTTIASIVLSYLVCCTLCLKDPQGYYDLIKGSTIAFMMMSTKRTQALQVIFSDTKARIDNSKWFRERYPRDDNFKNILSWPQKNVVIIPGDSLETTFEGYNILGGVMDEIDSHKKTEAKDYAESGYSTISARITSRFGKRGFLVLIGQTKTEGGFAMRRMEEFRARPHDRYACKMTIWESFGKAKFSGPVFYYDILRSKIVHADEFERAQMTVSSQLIEVPIEYLDDFDKDPDKALRDLAGIPRKVEDPFIRNIEKIYAASIRYAANHPLCPRPWTGVALARTVRCTDSLRRDGHMDLAYSSETGDAAALAIGHIREYVDTEEGLKPYLVIDVVARMLAPPGRQLELSDVRQVLYDLMDLGFKVKKVTLDGFQSTDTMQMLRKRGIFSDLLSVDKKMLPYADLRDAIYENRIEFPEVVMKHKRIDREEIDVLAKELSELGYAPNGEKVDHPQGGTKDCADAIAGVAHNLMLRARRGGRLAAPESGGAPLSGGTVSPAGLWSPGADMSRHSIPADRVSELLGRRNPFAM